MINAEAHADALCRMTHVILAITTPTVAVLNADHELAKVLPAHVVRDETPLVEQIKQLALLAELENQHVRWLKPCKKNNTRGSKRKNKQRTEWGPRESNKQAIDEHHINADKSITTRAVPWLDFIVSYQ